MTDAARLRYLRVALILVGLIFLLGIYLLGMVWPSGWTWGVGHSHYHLMIVGVYATLGVLLLLAAKNPAAHTSLTMSQITPSSWARSPSPMRMSVGTSSATSRLFWW